MIVSRLAVALSERYSVGLMEEISRAKPGEACVDIIESMEGYLSKDRILSCCLFWGDFEKHWTLDVMATRCSYKETSLTGATIVLNGQSLPATVMLACSNRSIPITRIIEPSATFDPFFLRNDVLVQSITEDFSIDWKARRRVPALRLAVTF